MQRVAPHAPGKQSVWGSEISLRRKRGSHQGFARGPVVFGAGGFDDLIALREKDFHIIRIGVYGHEPCEVAKAKRGLLQGLSLRGNESTTRQ